MIINKQGEKYIHNNVEYVIGEEIIGAEKSEYKGLLGNIYEIRTGKDKETENETPDIYCRFESPITNHDILKLEKTFSKLCGENKRLEDICFDSVILAPDMVETISEIEKDTEECTVYILEEDWAANYNYGKVIRVFSSAESAKREMFKILKKELKKDYILEWKNSEDYDEESEEYLFRCFIEGDYIDNHYAISITEKPMKVRYSFMLEFLKKYVDKE